MKKIQITVLAFALVSVFGCQKSFTVSNNSDASRQSIGFNAFTHLTKASAILGEEGARGGNFKMAAFQMSGTAEGTGVTATPYFTNDFGYGINSAFPSAWNTSTTQYWPATTVTELTTESVASESLSFFSYGPTSADGKFSITFDDNNYDGAQNRTLPKLTVSVAAANADQKDILAAMTEFNHWEDNNKVSINYNHILSAITFSAKTESAGFKFIVDEIIVGVANNDISTGSLYPTGVYEFAKDNEKGNWTGQTGTKEKYNVVLGSATAITKELTADVTTSLPLSASNGILMLIPQQLNILNNDAYFYVKYKSYKKNEDGVSYETTPRNYTKFAPLHITGMTEWKAGKKYNYVLNLADLDKKPIEYNVTVSVWDDWDSTTPTADVEIDFQNEVSSNSLPVFEEGTEFETSW